MKEERTDGTIQSGYVFFRIIDRLKEVEKASVSDLSKHLGMDRGHIHKYLKTLDDVNYVINEGGRYKLSFTFVSHAEYVKRRSELCTVCSDRIETVGEQIEDVVKFSVRQENRYVVVGSKNDENVFPNELMPGEIGYLHQSAPGKSILAELTEKERRRYVETTDLPAKNENTITEPQALLDELESIRRKGFAVSRGEWDPEINGISSSVNAPNGTIGAINVLGPANSHSPEYLIDEYADYLIHITGQIEHKLSDDTGSTD